MLCKFDRVLFKADTGAHGPDRFMIAVYRTVSEKAPMRIKAVGYGLPTGGLTYDLEGEWKKNDRYGDQYEVRSYREIIPQSEEGIRAFLASGQITGCGPKTAERIVAMFGTEALRVIENEPDKLLKVRGISRAKLKRITESYAAGRGARDIIAMLAPHGITAARALRLYRLCGDSATRIVRDRPYSLCDMAGIGFLTADRIAAAVGIAKTDPERLREGCLHVLRKAGEAGHMCLSRESFLSEAARILAAPGLVHGMIMTAARRLLADGDIRIRCGLVFLKRCDEAEESLAYMIRSRITNGVNPVSGADRIVARAEESLGVRLAPEQTRAVLTALQSPVSIITGGPGTGKTMLLRVLLTAYRDRYPNHEILCCAPTGRAARRMNRSAGFPASTLHKVLMLGADDDERESPAIESNLIVMDEVSMLDAFLAERLFRALNGKCRVVMIGDCDQLPSVGPGMVLSEIVSSGKVPVTRLTRVYRQASGSRIAVNASMLRGGGYGFDYGDDFRFVDAPDASEMRCRLIDEYMAAISRDGIDNVVLLTPMRNRTDTCVNALNAAIRELVNPASADKSQIVRGAKTFRAGDKVMQTKNSAEASNGDIGRIVHAGSDDGTITVTVDFGDGRIVKYDDEEIDRLDLAYACTIHKSQGSEYKTVIIALHTSHYVMLTRPLIYTAITRSMENVVIVGERRALCLAAGRTDATVRGTLLAERIRQ